MKKIKNEDIVNAFQAKKAAGMVDFAAQDAEMAMFAPQPRWQENAQRAAQYEKRQQRMAAEIERQNIMQADRDSKKVSVKVAHSQAIKMDAKAKSKAIKAFIKMEATYGKWFENQNHADPIAARAIDEVNAKLIMAGASWEFMIRMIEENKHDNGDSKHNMEVAIARYDAGVSTAAACFHMVNSIGNKVEGNMKLFGNLYDTLVDTETFKWSDHKQYLIRIVAYMNKQVKTKFIAERLAEYNVVDKMVKDNRDVEADKWADMAAYDKGQKIAPSFKAINDDILRTLALSYS